MTTEATEPNPLSLPCPDCHAPLGEPCIGTMHASRIDRAQVAHTLREGRCKLCGERLVLFTLHGQDVAVHPDPAHADVCPVIPDPQRDLAGWSTAINLGYEPGKPGIENWRPAASDEGENRATPPPYSAEHGPESRRPQDFNDLNAQIDRLHGPGAAAAGRRALRGGRLSDALAAHDRRVLAAPPETCASCSQPLDPDNLCRVNGIGYHLGNCPQPPREPAVTALCVILAALIPAAMAVGFCCGWLYHRDMTPEPWEKQP